MPDARAIGSVSDLHGLIATITGPDGLEIRDHFQHLRRFRASFRGDSLVSFLSERLCLPRPQALAIAERLETLEFIRHVSGVREFSDDAQLYGIGPGPRNQTNSGAQGSIDSLAEIVQAMRGPDGIGPGSRNSALVRYPNCFHGYEMVRWMCSNLGVSSTRATEIG